MKTAPQQYYNRYHNYALLKKKKRTDEIHEKQKEKKLTKQIMLTMKVTKKLTKRVMRKY